MFVDTVPQCTASPELGVKPGDTVRLTCGVDYAGNVAPVVKWKDENGAVLIPTTNTTSTRVESTVSAVAVDLSQQITAKTYFDDPPTEMMSDLVDSAIGAPNYTYSWSANLLNTIHVTGTLSGNFE